MKRYRLIDCKGYPAIMDDCEDGEWLLMDEVVSCIEKLASKWLIEENEFKRDCPNLSQIQPYKFTQQLASELLAIFENQPPPSGKE